MKHLESMKFASTQYEMFFSDFVVYLTSMIGFLYYNFIHHFYSVLDILTPERTKII